MKDKGSKEKQVTFIFAPHSEKALEYSSFVVKKLVQIIRILEKEKSRGVIIHEGAYVPVFDEKYLEKDNFNEVLEEMINVKNLQNRVTQRILRDSKRIERGDLSRFRNTPVLIDMFIRNKSLVRHVVEKYNFKTWIVGAAFEFYNEKTRWCYEQGDINGMMNYIEKMMKALIDDCRLRDENVQKQILEMIERGSEQYIIVPRGSAHIPLAERIKKEKIRVISYVEPWVPGFMEEAVMQELSGRKLSKSEKRICALRHMALKLEENRLKEKGKSEQLARRRAIKNIQRVRKKELTELRKKLIEASETCRKFNVKPIECISTMFNEWAKEMQLE